MPDIKKHWSGYCHLAYKYGTTITPPMWAFFFLGNFFAFYSKLLFRHMFTSNPTMLFPYMFVLDRQQHAGHWFSDGHESSDYAQLNGATAGQGYKRRHCINKSCRVSHSNGDLGGFWNHASAVKDKQEYATCCPNGQCTQDNMTKTTKDRMLQHAIKRDCAEPENIWFWSVMYFQDLSKLGLLYKLWNVWKTKAHFCINWCIHFYFLFLRLRYSGLVKYFKPFVTL